MRYIGSYSDSFIFHFFSPDLAGVPDLILLTPSQQGRGSLAGSGHAGSSYETSLSISLQRCSAAAARPPACIYLAFRLETAFLSPSSSPFSNSLEPRHQFFKSVSLNIPSHLLLRFRLKQCPPGDTCGVCSRAVVNFRVPLPFNLNQLSQHRTFSPR